MGEFGDGCGDGDAHLSLIDPFREAVDREQASSFVSLGRFIEPGDAGVAHRETSRFQFHFALKHDSLADSELLNEERLVEPDRFHVFVLLAEKDVENVAAGVGELVVDVDDFSDDAGQLSVFEVCDFGRIAKVLVFPGKEEEQIGGGPDSKFPEQFASLRPDAFDELGGLGQLFQLLVGGGFGLGRRIGHGPILRVAGCWSPAANGGCFRAGGEGNASRGGANEEI